MRASPRRALPLPRLGRSRWGTGARPAALLSHRPQGTAAEGEEEEQVRGRSPAGGRWPPCCPRSRGRRGSGWKAPGTPAPWLRRARLPAPGRGGGAGSRSGGRSAGSVTRSPCPPVTHTPRRTEAGTGSQWPPAGAPTARGCGGDAALCTPTGVTRSCSPRPPRPAEPTAPSAGPGLGRGGSGERRAPALRAVRAVRDGREHGGSPGPASCSSRASPEHWHRVVTVWVRNMSSEGHSILCQGGLSRWSVTAQ